MSLLLCRREKVKHPFYIEVLGIHIYSSQELCYVIYHHPLLVMNDFVDASLFFFVKNELGLGFLAGRMEKLVEAAGGIVCGRMTILAEGDAQKRDDVIYLEPLPVFHPDGTPKQD